MPKTTTMTGNGWFIPPIQMVKLGVVYGVTHIVIGLPNFRETIWSYLSCLNAWAHAEPYFYWCPKATEDETPASISKFAFYDWLRSPIRCQLLGETCVGCHGSRWGVKYVIGKWNLKNGKPPESLSVQMKYSFWFDCPKNGWLKKCGHGFSRAVGSPIVDQCVEGMIWINGWILHSLSLTIMPCFDKSSIVIMVKWAVNLRLLSSPPPGMHKLVDHKSRAATDANGADEIRFFIFALPKAQLLRHLHWISMVQDCHVGFFDW